MTNHDDSFDSEPSRIKHLVKSIKQLAEVVDNVSSAKKILDDNPTIGVELIQRLRNSLEVMKPLDGLESIQNIQVQQGMFDSFANALSTIASLQAVEQQLPKEEVQDIDKTYKDLSEEIKRFETTPLSDARREELIRNIEYASHELHDKLADAYVNENKKSYTKGKDIKNENTEQIERQNQCSGEFSKPLSTQIYDSLQNITSYLKEPGWLDEKIAENFVSLIFTILISLTESFISGDIGILTYLTMLKILLSIFR